MAILDFLRRGSGASPSPTAIETDNATRPQLTVEPARETTTASRSPPQNRGALLFGGGLTFFAFSILITRRALARRTIASLRPAGAPNPHATPNSAKDAIEAFNIATTNVVSLAMMATGGTLWYLKINSLEDARRLVRGGLGVDGSGRTEADAQEEFEEWMATTLSRKEAKKKARQALGTSSRDQNG